MRTPIEPSDYLSDKAKTIVRELDILTIPKTFLVDNTTEPALFNPTTNSIELNLEKIEDFDYFYLHELYHVYQREEGYPCIVTGEVLHDYKKIAGIISSFVLDFNVDNFLGNYNCEVSCNEMHKSYLNNLHRLQEIS